MTGISPQALFVVILATHTVAWFYFKYIQHIIMRRSVAATSVMYVTYHLVRAYDWIENEHTAGLASFASGIAILFLFVCIENTIMVLVVGTLAGAYIIIPDWHSEAFVLISVLAAVLIFTTIAILNHVGHIVDFIITTLATSLILFMGVSSLIREHKIVNDGLDTSKHEYWEYGSVCGLVVLRILCVYLVQRYAFNKHYVRITDVNTIRQL